MTRREPWREPYEQSMALCDYVGYAGLSPKEDDVPIEQQRGHVEPCEVERRWHRAFCCVAKYLGFNRATRRLLWDGLVHGNWERLHPTDEELKMPADHWLDKLYWEVMYCSDRWTLDRLTRCHWIYRQYMHVVGQEEDEC